MTETLTNTIDMTADDGTAITLTDTELVRKVTGKRSVYQSQLDGVPVFAKLFVNKTSKRRHLEAELKGLKALSRANIPAPEVLCAGKTVEGYPAIVSRAISGVSLETAWTQHTDEATRQALIRQLLLTLATHHEAGLQHNDPHLKNFFVAPDTLYTLDGADIQSAPAPLDESASLQNLGLVLAQFLPSDDLRALTLLRDYAQARGWQTSAELQQKTHTIILQKRDWRKNKYLKKIYRECTQVCLLNKGSTLQLMERSFDTPALREFLNEPDRFAERFLKGSADKCAMLKDGNSSTVVSLQLDGDAFVVKRYNLKGPLHKIKRMFGRSRAERSWDSSHLLGFYGIPTAEPVAIRVDKTGPFRGRAWFIAKHIPGQTLSEFVLENQHNRETLDGIVAQVVDIMQRLAEQRISHGDFKATNWLVTREGVMLIDLDSMEQHSNDASFEPARRKDIARFLQNWNDLPQVEELFVHALAGQVGAS